MPEHDSVQKMNDPLLIKYILEEMHKDVAGQDRAIIILTLKIMLRLVKNAQATSSNILISDKTGAGKDYLSKHICNLLLKDDACFHRTKLSPQVFNYWQPTRKIDGKITKESWDGKVIYLEDPDIDVTKSQGFKVMASGGNHMTVVKDQKVLNRKILGKPVIIVTSMKADIDDEGQRRFSIIRLENGENFIDACFNLEADKEDGIVPPPDINFQVMLKTLRSCQVKIPHLRIILKALPKTRLMNTQKDKLKDYIKASAVLHQHQREKNEEGILLANMFDFYLGLYVFCLSGDYENRSLNVQQEDIFSILEEAYSKKEIKKANVPEIKVIEKGLKTKNVANLTGISWNNAQGKLEDMQSKGLIIGFEAYDATVNRYVQVWKINPNFGGKVYKDLIKQIKRAGIKDESNFKKLFAEINKEREKNELSALEAI
jgi:hypothetical protein